MAMRYGMTVKTQLSYLERDSVIAQYAQGPYQISIGGLDETGKVRRKIMIIWFLPEDRQRLRAFFAVRRPAGGSAFTPQHVGP